MGDATFRRSRASSSSGEIEQRGPAQDGADHHHAAEAAPGDDRPRASC